MFYNYGKSADVRDLLREMFSAWLMAEESAHYTREHLRRCNETVNDLCRIVEEAARSCFNSPRFCLFLQV